MNAPNEDRSDLVVATLLDAATAHRQRGARTEALALASVALDVIPNHGDGLWLAAQLRAELGDEDGARATLGALASVAPDEPRAVLAGFLEAMADGTIAQRLPEVEEAMCRNVDVGEILFDCCLRVLAAEEALERAHGAMFPLGPGWPVRASAQLIGGAKALYLFLPSVFNSTRFTDRYFVDQVTFMRYNGDRLAKLLDYVLAEVQVPPGGRVFDAGCGNGYLLAALVARFGVAAWGQDNSNALRGVVEQAVPGVQFRVGDLSALAHADGFFDVVLCTDVLEHLPEPEAALAELVRITRPGGEVFLSVPDGRRDQGSGHVNFFGPEGLARLCRPYRHDPIKLHKSGLSVVIRSTGEERPAHVPASRR